MKVASSQLLWVCIAAAAAVAAHAEAPPLEQRLRSDSYWERMRAFREAVEVAPAERARYVPLLAAGLDDDDMELRLAAVQALSGFGADAEPALAAIVRTLEIRHGEARAQLVSDIARLGPLAVPALMAALEEADPYLVWGACDALAEIGAPARAAIPALERLVDDHRAEVRSGSRAALALLGGP